MRIVHLNQGWSMRCIMFFYWYYQQLSVNLNSLVLCISIIAVVFSWFHDMTYRTGIAQSDYTDSCRWPIGFVEMSQNWKLLMFLHILCNFVVRKGNRWKWPIYENDLMKKTCCMKKTWGWPWPCKHRKGVLKQSITLWSRRRQ